MDTPDTLDTVDTKLQAFRVRWLSVAPQAQQTERLSQTSPRAEATFSPRMVFRESEGDPAFFRNGKSRVSVTSALRLLKVSAMIAIAIVVAGAGLERLFDYAPNYLQTYLVTDDATR